MEDKESGRGETVVNGPAASTTPSTAARGSSFGYATLGGMNTKNRVSGGGNQAPNTVSSNASASVSSVPQNFPFIVHPYDVSRGLTSTSSKSSGSRGAKTLQSPFSSSTASNNLASASSIALETTSGSAMKPEQVLYGSPYVKAVLLNLWDFSSGPRTEQIWVGQSLKPSGENTKEEVQAERRAKGREEDEFNRSSRPVRSTSSSSLSSRPSTFNGNGDPMTTMLHGTVSLEALDHAHLSTSPPPPPVLSNVVPRPSMKVTKLLSRSGGAAGRGGVEDAKDKTGASPSLSDAVMDPSISSAAVQISTNRDSVGAVRTSAEANIHDGTHAPSPGSYDDDDSSDSLSQMIDENYVAKQRPPPKKGEINKKLRGRPLVASSHPKHSKTSQSAYSNGDNQELREDNSMVKNDHVYLADGDQDVARDEEVTLTSGGAIDSAPDSSLESPDLGFSKYASPDLLSSSQDDPSNYSECVEEGVVEEGTATSTTSDLDGRGDSETSSEDAWSDEDEGEEVPQDLGGDCPENSDDNAECDESYDDDDDDLDDGSDVDDEDWDQKHSNPSIRNPQRRFHLESSSGAYFSDEDDGEDFKQRERYLLPKEYLESNIHPNNTQEEARNRARRRRKRRQKKGEVRRIFESGNIVSISSYIAKYTLGSDLAELVSSSSASGSQGPQQGGIMMDPWNITSLPPPPASTSPTPTMNSSSNAPTQGDNPVSSMLGDGGSFFAQQVMSSTMANIFGGSSSQSGGGSGGGSSGYSSSSGVEMGTKSFASTSKKSMDDLAGGGSGDYLDGNSQGRGTDSPHPSSSAAAMLPGEDDDEAVAKLGVEHKLHVFEDAPYFTLSAVFTAPYNVKISSPSGATSGNANAVTASSNTMLHSASAMLGFTSPLDPPTPAPSSHNPSSTTSTSSTLIPSFSADPTKFSFSILLPYEFYPSFLRHQTAITDRLNQWVVFYVYLCQLRPQQALVLVHKEIVRSVLQINRLLACEGIPLPSLKHTLFSVAKSTSIDPNHSSFGSSSHASGTSKNGKGSHQANATGAASQNGNTGQAAPNSPRGGHSPSPFPPSLLASPHLHGSANQFDFTSGDEASFGSTPSGPSFANQSLYSLAAATSASEYPTSGYDMSGAGFTSSPSSSAAELPPFLPLSTFPSSHPTPLSGTDCPSPGGNQPDSGKWRLGDPGKMTMNSMPTPSVSLSSKAHASLAASAAQLSASSDGREGVLMEGGQPKFESNPSSPVLSQHAAANLPEMDYRRTRDFLSLILTSHFQTHQRTVIMGDDLDLVNLYVATISLFLSPEDRQKSRYATYHNIPSFLGGKTSNPHKTATSPVGSASSLSGVTSTHGAPMGGLASPMGSQTALPTSTHHRHRSYSSSGPHNAETSTVHQGQTSRGGSGEIRGTTKASTPQPTTIVSSGSFHDSNEMDTGQQQEGAEGQRSTNTQGKDGSATNPSGAPMAAGRRTVHSSRSSSNLQGMMSAAGVGPGGQGQVSQVGGLSSTLNPSYLNPVHPTSYTAASATTGSSSSQSFAAHQMHSHFFMDGFVPDLVLQGIHGNSKMVRNSAYIQGQMPVTLVDLNRRLVTQTHPFHQFRLLRCEYHQSVLYKLLRVKKTNLWSSQETLFQTVKEPSSFIRKLVLESMRIPDSLILPFISISLKNIMARTYTLVKYVEGLEQGFPPYPASSSTRTAQTASDPAHRDDSSTFGEETTSRTGEEARSTESKSSSPGLTPSPTPTSTSAFSSFFSSVKGGDSKQGTTTPAPLNASSQSAGGPVSANTTLLSSNTTINTGAAAQGVTISPHPSNAYYSTGPAVPSHSDPYADLQFSDAHSSNPRIHPAKNSASLTPSTNTPSPTPPPSIDTSLAIIDLGDGTTASALPALSSSNSLTSIFASPPANLFHHHHHHLYQHNHATTPSLSASQYGVSMTDIRSNPSILRRIRHDLDLDEPCFTVLLGIAELLKPGIFRALFGDPMSQEKKWIELFEGL